MSNEKNQKYEVPTDYPSNCHLGALTGTQAKVTLVWENGQLYIPGDTPSERHVAWQYSEYMTKQFVEKCLVTKNGRRFEMRGEEIIAQYADRAIAAGGFGSPAQVRWTFRQVATRLGWPIPKNCLETLDAEK